MILVSAWISLRTPASLPGGPQVSNCCHFSHSPAPRLPRHLFLSFLGSYLVLVQLTVLVFLLPLLLEGDDDETHEDVHHEEGNDDDVDDEKDGDLHTVVVDGALVFCVGVDGAVQQPAGGDRPQREAEKQCHLCGMMAPLLLGILGSGVLETALGWESEDLGSSPSSATYWCGTIGKSLNLFESQILHLYNGDNKPDFPTWQCV